MYGCQCPKRLFYHKYRRDLRNPEEEQQALYDAGISVGEVARGLFPNGVDATPPDSFSYHLAVASTKKYIEQGETVIYEAAFQYDGVLCAIDILVKEENVWRAYEVKSTLSVKDQHITDAALQFYVISNSGLTIDDFFIVNLNKEYYRNGDADLIHKVTGQHLFKKTSVLKEVVEEQTSVDRKIFELKALIDTKVEPVIEIGSHCFDPYPCNFTEHCWAHVPKTDSVFDLPDKAAWKSFESGYMKLEDIPEDFKLGKKATMQLAHYKSGEVHIDKEEIKTFLDSPSYPLYFFDFETIRSAIPEFDESRPLEQIPFQYSLHKIAHEGAALEHFEFLGDGVNDPRHELIKSMIADLGTTGSIICYNMTFEKSCNNDLACDFPEFENELEQIKDRIVDLMTPFSKRWYYHPNFANSHSIKVVLPVLIPELRYEDLEIQEGGTSSRTYAQLKKQEKEVAEMQRRHLQEYCKLDTLAMVRIWEYLKTLK